MKPEALLHKVESALDLLIETGARYNGLIPSILDRHTGQMFHDIPGPIPGQRQHDRAPRGCNLLHDVDLLELMYKLAQDPSRQHFAEAADRYLSRFARHCTNTVSGLFPWGEHAYWDLERDELGNAQVFAHRNISRGAYHDHLREAPLWLWQRIYHFNAECVERFAYGLKFHWKSGKLAHEYFRHAYIERPDIPLPHEAGSRDFPRHGAFYILDWAFAYCRFGRADFEAQMRRMNDYWWWHHHSPSGMLPQFSRDDNLDHPENWLSMGQSLSYAATTLEAAAELNAKELLPDLAKSLRERAIIYAQACVSMPQKPEELRFYHMFERDSLEGAEHAQLVAWGSTYSMQAQVASRMTIGAVTAFMMRIYRHTRDQRFVDWCKAAARLVIETPFPEEGLVPARDASQALDLMLDLYDVTQQDHWLENAQSFVEKWMEVYFDSALPRLAPGMDWYEGQQGSGTLLRSLGRYALTRRDANANSLTSEK
jgi:hypothetical protein